MWDPGRRGGAAGGGGVAVVVLVLSQNKVLQRFAEQILDDQVVDRVQQRFEEQDFEVPRVSLVQSGGVVLRRGQAARALARKPGLYFYELLFWQTLALCLRQSTEAFGIMSSVFRR